MATMRKRLNGKNASSVVTTRNHLAPIIVSKYPNLARRRMESEKFNLPLLENLAMLGMSDKDIAQALGINPGKFKRYKKKHSSIRVTLRKGRVVAAGKVVKSLYKKANGFSVPEEKLFYSAKYNRVVRADTRKYYPPDTVAQIFWLKNHAPDFWRDRKEVETIGAVGSIQTVKFILVQPGASGEKNEKVIDGDFKILPGAGQEGREKLAESGDKNKEVE